MTLFVGALLLAAGIAATIACAGSTGSAGPAGGTAATVLTPGAPSAESLARLLSAQVDVAPGETNQYLIRAPHGSVDLSKVGRIDQDLGYAVGVTLPNGIQIGFRYEPVATANAKE